MSWWDCWKQSIFCFEQSWCHVLIQVQELFLVFEGECEAQHGRLKGLAKPWAICSAIWLETGAPFLIILQRPSTIEVCGDRGKQVATLTREAGAQKLKFPHASCSASESVSGKSRLGSCRLRPVQGEKAMNPNSPRFKQNHCFLAEQTSLQNLEDSTQCALSLSQNIPPQLRLPAHTSRLYPFLSSCSCQCVLNGSFDPALALELVWYFFVRRAKLVLQSLGGRTVGNSAAYATCFWMSTSPRQ